MPPRTSLVFAAAILAVTAFVYPVAAQGDAGLGSARALAQHHPGLLAQIQRLNTAHALLFEELVSEGEAVRSTRDKAPTPGFESALVDRLVGVAGPESTNQVDANTIRGFGALGMRAAEVINWGQALQREVISILADPDVADHAYALAAAVIQYQSRPETALPGVPKNMDVLYGHPYARDFRTMYPDLSGLGWAGHWLGLATTEPLTDLPPGAERRAGVDTVTARYFGKLSYGEPPQAFPSELPLAPAIAPGLIWLSPEAAMIWDNLSMLLEVLGDVVASSETVDVAGAIDATLDYFLDPALGITDRDEWEIMALRHGIFFQGGYPLAVMTQNERNMGGHAAHLGGRMLMAIPGMPRR